MLDGIFEGRLEKVPWDRSAGWQTCHLKESLSNLISERKRRFEKLISATYDLGNDRNDTDPMQVVDSITITSLGS